MNRKTIAPARRAIAELGRIRCTGRFRGIVHTGHTYDADGNVVKFGDVVRETPFGRNTITLSGFNRMLAGDGVVYLGMVAGDGNSTPDESDSSLDSYLGRYTSKASVSTERNTNPDNGPLYYRLTFRGTFAPGALGASSVNVAEAGITMSAQNISSINSGTPVGARGLMVDESSSPVAVPVAPDEYFDLVWEYTEWLPTAATGVVSLDIDGVPTNFDYEVRPSYLTGGSSTVRGWTDMHLGGDATNNMPFPSEANRQWFAPIVGSGSGYSTNTAAAAGPLGAASEGPGGTYNAAFRPSAFTASTYTSDSKQRAVTIAWSPSAGNVSGGIGAVNILLGHTQWQVSYDPPIPKVEGKQLSLAFLLGLGNA